MLRFTLVKETQRQEERGAEEVFIYINLGDESFVSLRMWTRLLIHPPREIEPEYDLLIIYSRRIRVSPSWYTEQHVERLPREDDHLS